MGPRAIAPLPPLVIAGGLMALSLVLRTGTLDAGYWIDEAIAVGIASRDVAEIPRALLQDGSPPLYYLLLHGWMQLAGDGEAATRALSLVFAVLAVPVSWWAGASLFGRRAGALAAAGAAGCPFLTYYAQETRMYSLVAVLSVLACASFVLAFLHGRRRHVPLLGAWLVLLLYAHAWGLFLAVGMGAAWLALWREGRVDGRTGVRLGAVVGLLYAPWVPSLLYQAAHTGAPWAERPGALELLGIPGGLFGYLAAPLLGLAAAGSWRQAKKAESAGRREDEAVRTLVIVAAATAAVAFACSQLQPAWSTRYLAVLFGPLLLALAAALSRGTRWTAAPLAAVAALWLASPPPAAKSNARGVAATVAPAVRAGDIVVSTQPEQVPVLQRYLPQDVVYLTPLGVVPDPRLTDWRDGVARLQAGRAERVLLPLLEHVERGRRVLLVTPVRSHRLSQAPWSRAVRIRTREWRAALRNHPRLRQIGRAPRSTWPRRRSTIRAELFEVSAAPARPLRRRPRAPRPG